MCIGSFGKAYLEQAVGKWGMKAVVGGTEVGVIIQLVTGLIIPENQSYILNLYLFATMKYKEGVAYSEDMGMIILHYHTKVSYDCN
jgi:hypothetical protein